MTAREHDERYMRVALEEAHTAAELGEVPIGAVVVYRGKIVSRAHNLRERNEDPSAHAEFTAMCEAARTLGRWRLTGCTVYVTLEPCCMCAGLMVNARIDRCVFGAPDPKGGATGSLFRLHADARLNHAFAVTPGVLGDECAALLREFFGDVRRRRALEGDRTAPEDVPSAPAVPRETSAASAPSVLLAVDSFKGSATSGEAEKWISAGIRRACPDASIVHLPFADGGEGTLDALAATLGGEMRACLVPGPLGDEVAARYLVADVGGVSTAVIELAQAAGICLSPCTHDAAMAASTLGVGCLVRDAVARGARRCCFALGGSATTDGGAGMLRALGARLLDEDGSEVPAGLAGLERLASIDLAPALGLLSGCELVVLSDVDNPLAGKRGAVRVFAPQKGLGAGMDPDERERALAQADAWMVRYGRLLDAARAALEAASGEDGGAAASEASRPRAFRSVIGVPGAGAAGGVGAALLALSARLESGAEAVLDLIGFDEKLADADLVVTGEGFMDEQTAAGKAPIAVARRAHRAHVPVAAVAGGRAERLESVYARGVDLVVAGPRHPMSLADALSSKEVEANLVCAGEEVARAYLLGR
ncbi:MAG: glycerate kinase [Collinsella phocaeensis]